jgi:MFS transporter, DHA3 family, macrolide efflux protein
MAAGDHPPLFRQRNFLALWSGQLVSIIGDRLTYLALGGMLLQHIGDVHDRRYATQLALLGNVMLAPVLLFSPFTGAWVDRWNLKRVLIISDVLRAGVVVLVPMLYAATHRTGPAFALVFVLFTCNVFFLPARSAITPEIVPRNQLLAANAFLSAAGIAATALGALAGGWVVDHWGWPIAMQFDALTYLISVITLSFLRYRGREEHAAMPAISWHGYLHEVGEGLTIVRTNAVVGLALTALAAVWIGGGFLQVAGVQHIQESASKPGMERLGLLMCAVGLGAGLGTWWVNTRGRRWPQPILLGGGLLLVGLGIVAFAVSSRFAVFAIAAFLIGIFAAPTFFLAETLMQQSTELDQRGRVFSLRDFLTRLAFLVSVNVAVLATHTIGVMTALILSAALVALVGGFTLGWGRHVPALMKVAPRNERPPAGR